MLKTHHYQVTVSWKGNLGSGTSDYKSYSRNHNIVVEGKPVLAGSSDASFRGDPYKYTPEDLLLSSLSGCHMLWYLHLCAVNGVIVLDYTDEAQGKMQENADGSGQFVNVMLRPQVFVSEPSMIEKARSLHTQANEMCFIARSVNFPVHHNAKIVCHENTPSH